MSEPFTFRAATLEDTEAFAASWSALLQSGDVIGLRGDLGAGKTAFARALIRALGHDDEVPSPTYTLIQIYEMPGQIVWHVDLYRIENEDEIRELDLDAAFEEGLTLIEWPDRLGSAMPPDWIEISIHEEADEARTFSVTGHGTGQDRVDALERQL